MVVTPRLRPLRQRALFEGQIEQHNRLFPQISQISNRRSANILLTFRHYFQASVVEMLHTLFQVRYFSK